MTVIRKNSLLKRITAFVLALLMVFTLMPWENYVTFAEEEGAESSVNTPIEYSFVVTDADGNAVQGAKVYLYDMSEDTSKETETTLVKETDAEGKVTFSSAEDGYAAVAEADIYKVVGTGEQTYVRGMLTTDSEIEVSLPALGLYLSCTVSLEGVAQAGAKVYLLKDTNSDNTGDTVVAEQLSDVNGFVQFTDGLAAGTYELIAITDNHKGTAKKVITSEDVTNAGSTEVVLKVDDGIALVEKTNASFTLAGTDASLSLGETAAIVPQNTTTLKIGTPVFTYVSENTDVATVDENGKVTAVGEGRTAIQVTMATEEYNVATATYTVSVAGASITGTVSPDLINEAVVKLKKEDGTTVKEVTVSNGAYTFSAVGAGKYKVCVECAGYATVEQEVEISETQETSKEKVTIDPIQLREKVTVSFTDIDLLTNIGLEAQNVKSVCTVKKASDGSVLSSLTDFKITYEVDSENVVTINTETGAVTAIKEVGEGLGKALGKATVTATITSDKYEIETDSDLSYEVGVWEFAFVDTNLKDTVSKTYGEDNFSTKAILKGADENTTKEVKVEYKSSDNDTIAKISNVVDEATGEVTDVQVQIVGANDTSAVISASYGGATISYEVKVNKAKSAGLKWKIPDGETLNTQDYVYGGKTETYTAVVDEGIVGVEIVYSSSNSDIVAVNSETGEIDINDVTAENETVTIYAKTVSDNYEEETLSYNITVAKGEQDAFTWKKENGSENYFADGVEKVVTLAYNDTVPTIIAGGQYENAVVSYVVKDENGNADESVVSVDPATGKLTINGIGTAVVQATVAENNHYNTRTIEYKVVVNKATDAGLSWNLKEGETTEKVYKFNEKIESLTASLADNVKNVTVKYSSDKEDIVSVDEITGTIQIKDVTAENEKVTITATTVSAYYDEQSITYTIVVNKGTQDTFTWKQENGVDDYFAPNDTEKTITVEYSKNATVPTILASGQDEKDTATVTYSLADENGNETTDTGVVSVDQDGKVTVNGHGTAIVKATVAGNNHYNSSYITYKIIVKKAVQNLAWNAEDLKVLNKTDLSETGGKIEVVYGKGLSFKLGVTGQHGDLEYGFTTESDNITEEPVVTVSKDGTVKINRQGTVKISYTATNADDNYEAKTLSYTLVVKKANQTDFKWNNGYTDETEAKIVFAPSKTITNVLAINACDEATVTYSSSNDDIASVDPNTGAVTIHNVGLVKITATATVPDAGNYNTRSISYTYNITQSAHTAFAWKGGNPGTVKLTYEDAAPNPVAVGQCENAVVTYTSSNPSVASVDSATGVVTIKKAGEATITATAAATRNYSETKISYKLVIEKKVQTMSFSQETYTLINGYNKFVSPVITTQNVTATAGKIVYSVPENNGVVTINPSTGELEFTLQPGTVTVTATKPTDEQYIGTETEYTLTVLEWDPLKGGKTSPYYTVTGTQEDASSSWFTHYSKNDPVQLTAGTNYVLYKSEKDPVPNTKWASAISVSNVHEGKDNAITFYVKDTVNGYVSKQYTLNNIKVDSVVPTASIAIDDVTIWEKILSFFTFDLAGQDTPELEITSSDKTSGVKAVYYYISNTTEPLESKGLIDVNALEKEADWKTYDGVVDLEEEEVTKNVIYAKVVDKAGNSTYVATNGLIFDGTKPVVTPTIVTKDVNGYYNKNVEINLDVVDAEPYSGVKEITYVVENDGKVTDSGTLYTFEPEEEDNPKHSELISEWNSDDYDKNVIVKAADNNSDDVKVTFTVTDNAGNTTESVVELKIDITDPIINVVYDNNNGDATFADGVYFNADRTATITVSERHFNKDEFILTITNSDGTIPELSKWTKTSKGTGNGDDITYTATVYFGADGDYTLDISYVDEAGNKCDEINYGESQAPTAFTLDKTIPTISVSYDNNDALNENYFKADRTATIVIQEHNFDASRVNAIITATDNGEPIAAPIISGWSTSGDTHTATISYSSDALYSFDIEYLDKAGNSIVDVAEQSFYVDKTMPQVSITEIVDQSANNAEKIGFVITATDTNFDVFTPVITAVIQTENGITTTELEAGSISEITNGQIYTVDNLDADGIYSITCTVIDKAGNAYTEVNLQREDGSTYVENRAGEDTLLMFSVNRDGSTFAVDDSTQSVLDNEYIQNIENDIVIYEVNTNELVSYALTLNGEELTEGTDYTVTSTGGDGTWMRYTYTVNKELFEAEGEYILVVSSTDGAENDAFSDVKNANISFIVDRTAPIVTVTGMESNRSYQTEAQIVTVMPTDDGGIIESLIIHFVDRDGNITDEIFAKSGDELRELLETNGGIITFELSDVTRENIQIICSDKAYDANGQSNTFNQIYENITVSASAVAIFFAGNTIYYILGGVATVATLAIGVFLKKRKSSKAKNA